MTVAVRRLGAGDLAALNGLLDVFGAAFEDPDTYGAHRPAPGYSADVLGRDHVIVLVAEEAGAVLGGLIAYDLPKLEQPRSEIYLYDLAVAEPARRRGVATALIDRLCRIADARGAWVVFVQADHGDDPAIALYTKLGAREDVLHFDIAPRQAVID